MITSNINDAQGATGYMAGFSQSLTTPYWIGPYINYVHSELAPQFDLHVDRVARKGTQSKAGSLLAHVYEWPSTFRAQAETVGMPPFRLWRHKLEGRGSQKTATFKFISSKRAVPVNPILLEPGKTGKSVRKGVHIFHWKAPAMEYGIEITVQPKQAQYLAFVNGKKGQGIDSDQRKNKVNDQGITFSKGPVSFTAGGGKHAGKFSAIFIDWWRTDAEKYYNKYVIPKVEKDLALNAETGIRKGLVKNKSFTMGARAAEFDVKLLSKNYEREAAAKSAFLGSNDE